MCKTQQHSDIEYLSIEKKYRLADFFNAHWDNYIQAPKRFIREEEYKTVML